MISDVILTLDWTGAREMLMDYLKLKSLGSVTGLCCFHGNLLITIIFPLFVNGNYDEVLLETLGLGQQTEILLLSLIL